MYKNTSNLKSDQESQTNNNLPRKKPGLGRGLDALFSSNTNSHKSVSNVDQQSEEDYNQSGQTVKLVPIINISPNPNQPRKEFDESKLLELSVSISKNGLLQPILLQLIPNNKYIIIAGERRFRASKMAGLEEVPCMIIEIPNEQKMLELALLENIQRSDLSVVEEARAYASLIEDFSCTHDRISKTLGKSRSHITNCLRMLKMPDFVVNLVGKGDISFGHAKILAGLEDPSFWAQMVLEKGLTVRTLEQEIAKEKHDSDYEKEFNKLPLEENNKNVTKSNLPKQYTNQKENNKNKVNDSNVKDAEIQIAISKFNGTFFNLGNTDIVEEDNGEVYIVTRCKNKRSALDLLNTIISRKNFNSNNITN